MRVRSIQQIADEVGCQVNTVGRALEAADLAVTPRAHRHTPTWTLPHYMSGRANASIGGRRERRVPGRPAQVITRIDEIQSRAQNVGT